ncbi:hypothetical protein AB1N83_012102 [Pleurotus pulmonarius]|nr:hypothetical protein EYR38_002399 [Pleurotus pulmonarius]
MQSRSEGYHGENQLDDALNHLPYPPAMPIHNHPYMMPYPVPFYSTPPIPSFSSDYELQHYASAPQDFYAPQYSSGHVATQSHPSLGPPRTTAVKQWHEKLAEILDMLKALNWTIGDLLYHLFRSHSRKGDEIKRSRSHAQMVSKFLGGKGRYYPTLILAEWLRSADGLPGLADTERGQMYSVSIDYRNIRAARPGLTSFAAQLVGGKLEQEIKQVVRKENGLQTFTTGGGDIRKAGKGTNTIADSQKIFQLHQPLAWAYALRLATPQTRRTRSASVVQVKKSRRAPELAVTNVLSVLAYSRNMWAKSIPLEKGLLLFACRANRYLFSYDSRVCSSASYHATYDALTALAKHDLELVKQLGRSPDVSFVLRLDNVQSYVRPRNLRLGREAQMNIGTAATAFLMRDFSLAAVDLDRKLEIKLAHDRRDLTVSKLRKLIDYENLDRVCIFQWLRTLVTYIPSLHQYKPAVSALYATEAKKMRLKLEPTQIFPLSTNGRNETITSELLKALVDFFAAIGQTEDSYDKRLIYVLGDGLTYERMVLLKLYMQFHETQFQRLEILKPGLESWHTLWTDLSRIYEAHWVSDLSRNPASLGHSANQIKQKAPADVKKVDFYKYSQLAYMVLDARILDCWRGHLALPTEDLLTHFQTLADGDCIPTLASLRKDAELLYYRFGHSAAFYRAMDGMYADDDKKVPVGQPWEGGVELNEDIGKTGQRKGKSKSKDGNALASDIDLPFNGDQALAESTRLIMDLTLNREMAYATSDGDPERVWDIMKNMAFTFAGSSHTKYSHYILEQLCDLELESSPEERTAFLANYIVNPTGKEGHWIAGDQYQEQLQDELYEHMARNDKGFDENYMRNVIAPNAHRFLTLKKNMNAELGLASRSGKHIEPHSNPELRTLLRVYREEGLHQFRSGRRYGGNITRVDDLERGMARLYDGKLKAWANETMNARGNPPQPEDSGEDAEQVGEPLGEENDDNTTGGHEVESAYVLPLLEDLDREILANDAAQPEELKPQGAYIQLEGGELVIEPYRLMEIGLEGDLEEGEEEEGEDEDIGIEDLFD